MERVGAPGAAIGWLAAGGFTDTTVSLASGEMLLLFTDGLLEALGHAAADDRRVQAVLGAQRARSAEEIAAAFDAQLADRLRDDAAFLVVRID